MQLEASKTGKLEAELSRVADSLTVAARHLIVRDHVIGIKFMVDIAADVSTIPVSRRDRTHISDRIFYAANGTIIPTYGQKLLQLDLGFRRVFQWPFIIADVDIFILLAQIF